MKWLRFVSTEINLTEIPIMNKANKKKRTLKIYVVSEKFEYDTICIAKYLFTFYLSLGCQIGQIVFF